VKNDVRSNVQCERKVCTISPEAAARCVDSEVARAKIRQDAATHPSLFAAIFNGKRNATNIY